MAINGNLSLTQPAAGTSLMPGLWQQGNVRLQVWDTESQRPDPALYRFRVRTTITGTPLPAAGTLQFREQDPDEASFKQWMPLPWNTQFDFGSEDGFPIEKDDWNGGYDYSQPVRLKVVGATSVNVIMTAQIGTWNEATEEFDWATIAITGTNSATVNQTFTSFDATYREVDPIPRIEGHLGVSLAVGSDGFVKSAEVHGNLFRGFENLVLGREANDPITYMQRICGV